MDPGFPQGPGTRSHSPCLPAHLGERPEDVFWQRCLDIQGGSSFMKQFSPFLRGGLKRASRLLCMCLLTGFVFTFLVSPHVASAQTLHTAMPAGTVCTNDCQGG